MRATSSKAGPCAQLVALSPKPGIGPDCACKEGGSHGFEDSILGGRGCRCRHCNCRDDNEFDAALSDTGDIAGVRSEIAGRVNDARAQPWFFVTTEANDHLLAAIERDILAPLRKEVGAQRRVTLVFDREGWSPKAFARWVAAGFDVMTYRKGRYDPWPEDTFVAVVDPTPTRGGKPVGAVYLQSTRRWSCDIALDPQLFEDLEAAPADSDRQRAIATAALTDAAEHAWRDSEWLEPGPIFPGR